MTRDSDNSERSGLNFAPFPKDFLWGAATAAHQVEGNNINSNWWEMEHSGVQGITEPSGDAVDHYHRFADDIAMLADAGLNSYRFSLEWARIEPEKGFFSHACIDHYRRMIDTCLEQQLEPVITLMHFTVPRWMNAEGFWYNRDAPELFARYTDAVLPILSSGVRYVCTINEPNIAAMLAGSSTTESLPSGALPEPDLHLADQLLAAHKRAREILGSIPHLRSGWTIATQDFTPTDEAGAVEKTAEYAYSRETWYLEQATDDDFVGVQAYTRTLIGPNGPYGVSPEVEQTLTGWEYFPRAAADGIRTAWEKSAHTPILVTENGIATDNDDRRISYTEESLSAIHDVIDEGIDVRGYIHWSALDNFEWASGFRPTFGLIAVNRETFARTPKPSLFWLGDVAHRNHL